LLVLEQDLRGLPLAEADAEEADAEEEVARPPITETEVGEAVVVCTGVVLATTVDDVEVWVAVVLVVVCLLVDDEVGLLVAPLGQNVIMRLTLSA